MRLIVALCAVVLAALVASVPLAQTWSNPAQPEWIVTEQKPVVGKRFTPYVQLWSEEARAHYESTEAKCIGALYPRKGARLLRTLAPEVLRLPEGAPVPKVVAWTWSIPPKTAGMRFGVGCSGTSVMRLPDGGRLVS